MSLCKLYLLDDHRVFLDGLERILRSNPEIEVLGTFDRAADMLEALKFNLPDVLISDISMPGISGIDAAKSMQKDFPDVKIIFLSMHSDPIHARQAIDAGAKGYVLKDSRSEEVFDAIKMVREGRTYISPRVTMTLLEATDQTFELSPREKQVLQDIALGLSTKEMAEKRGLSSHTIDTHRKNLLAKTGCQSVGNLVVWGIKHGFIDMNA